MISMLIHLSSYEGVNVLVSAWLDNRRPRPTTEIEIIEHTATRPDAKNEKPILHQLEPTDLVKNNDPARFDSEKTQRVKLETKAREFGLTKNQTSLLNLVKKSQRLPTENTATGDGEPVPEFARHMATGNTQTSASLNTHPTV